MVYKAGHFQVSLLPHSSSWYRIITMNYFLAISIFGCVVSYSSAEVTPTPVCDENILLAVARCIEAYDLSAVFIRFQTNTTTAEDLRQSCELQEKYRQALQCALNVTSPCSPDYITTTFEQVSRNNLAYCGDPRVNFECLAEYARNKSEIASCIDSHGNLTDVSTRSNQESLCYGRKLSIKCATEFLRPCDAYTATAVGNKLKLSTPLVCYFFPHLID